ncbi:MAG TPA: sigma-70 family RNA polymerase sigma factor [Pseudonocardia sp.]|nr:sigma-70 family RNA polymerase sigma factor [Pseudonocardia sp.]
MTARADPAVAEAVADAHRSEWAYVLAATVRVTRDLDLAEECVQDAYAKALASWVPGSPPSNPGAWLTTVARRRALDLARRGATARRALPLLIEDAVVAGVDDGPVVRDDAVIPDDRLRLVFTCCHPTLGDDARVALTLRLMCGLSTAEVARAFLVTEATMAARITRAKKKITTARIPYRVPPAEELPERVAAVLDVVHLLFSTGHAPPAGDRLIRTDLVARAVDLATMLRALLPDHPEVTGLLALVLLTDARRPARLRDGRLVLLADQDRALWDRRAIDTGTALVREALGRGRPGRFTLMAAIAAVHDEAATYADTDWREIVALYDLLAREWPSPVVSLNRAVAVGLAHGPVQGLAALDALAAEPRLAGYGYLPAARADFLARTGDVAAARLAYQEALLLTENVPERTFLAERLAALPP